MILSDARDILRRRLKDRDAQVWTNSQLLVFLNQAIMRIQAVAQKSDQEAHLKIWTADLVSGSQYYDIPAGLLYEVAVGLKDSEYATGYRPLPRVSFYDRRGRTAGQSLDSGYSRFTNKFYIDPAPSDDETDGLQIIGVPTLSAADDDNTELPLHIALHWMVILRAQIMALGDTSEDVQALWSELKEANESIPEIYVRSGGEAEVINLGDIKDY